MLQNQETLVPTWYTNKQRLYLYIHAKNQPLFKHALWSVEMKANVYKDYKSSLACSSASFICPFTRQYNVAFVTRIQKWYFLKCLVYGYLSWQILDLSGIRWESGMSITNTICQMASIKLHQTALMVVSWDNDKQANHDLYWLMMNGSCEFDMEIPKSCSPFVPKKLGSFDE